MSESEAVDLTDVFRAADDQAAAEAHSDAWATATYYTTLIEQGVPDELAADLVRAWLDAYLDDCGPVE